MLSGETSIDGGEVVLQKGTRVALHDQRPPRERDITLRDYVVSGGLDGWLYVLYKNSGALKWKYDTAQKYQGVNGVEGNGEVEVQVEFVGRRLDFGAGAFVLATRGGRHAGTPSDLQSAYVRQFLGFIGITDVEFIYAEGLAMGEESRTAAIAEAGKRIEQLAA